VEEKTRTGNKVDHLDVISGKVPRDSSSFFLEGESPLSLSWLRSGSTDVEGPISFQAAKSLSIGRADQPIERESTVPVRESKTQAYGNPRQSRHQLFGAGKVQPLSD
jgi:hypothetical protein